MKKYTKTAPFLQSEGTRQSTSPQCQGSVLQKLLELRVGIAQHKLKVFSCDKQHAAVGPGCTDGCLQLGEDDTSSRPAPRQRRAQH